jgi:hypothetical protein
MLLGSVAIGAIACFTVLTLLVSIIGAFLDGITWTNLSDTKICGDFSIFMEIPAILLSWMMCVVVLDLEIVTALRVPPVHAITMILLTTRSSIVVMSWGIGHRCWVLLLSSARLLRLVV